MTLSGRKRRQTATEARVSRSLSHLQRGFMRTRKHTGKPCLFGLPEEARKARPKAGGGRRGRGRPSPSTAGSEYVVKSGNCALALAAAAVFFGGGLGFYLPTCSLFSSFLSLSLSFYAVGQGNCSLIAPALQLWWCPHLSRGRDGIGETEYWRTGRHRGRTVRW